MMKKTLVIFFITINFFCLNAQSAGFWLTPANQCASSSNTAVAAINNNPPGITHYSWTILSPSLTCNPTFSILSSGIPSNSTISITFPCCGIYTVISLAYINSFLLSTITQTTAIICFSSTETISISNSAANTTICPGNSATLTASGGASYFWPTLNSTSPTVVVNPTITTCYKAIGTNTLGCGAYNISCINVITPPDTLISGNTRICSGETATLTALGVTSYTWGNGSTSPSLVVSPSITSTYTLTGNNGCSNLSSIFTVTVDPTPTITLAPSSTTICTTSSATLVASGANTYTWNNGSISNSIVVTPLASTIYSVEGSDQNCSGFSSPITITVISNPTVLITPSQTVICTNTALILTASGAGTYSWNAGPATSSYVVNPGTATIYTVSGTYLSCITEKTVSVQVLPNPSVTVSGSSLICSGESGSLSAAGAISYSWSNQSITSSISVLPLTTTIYTVNGTDVNGCSGTAIYTLTVNSCLSIYSYSYSYSENNFSVYPNPASSTLIIQDINPGVVSFGIYDLSGRELTKDKFSNTIRLDISNLSTGTYIIRLQSSEQKVYKKLVIEK